MFDFWDGVVGSLSRWLTTTESVTLSLVNMSDGREKHMQEIDCVKLPDMLYMLTKVATRPKLSQHEREQLHADTGVWHTYPGMRYYIRKEFGRRMRQTEINAIIYYINLILERFRQPDRWFSDMREAWNWAYEEFEKLYDRSNDEYRKQLVKNWPEFLRANLCRAPHITGGRVTHKLGVGRCSASDAQLYHAYHDLPSHVRQLDRASRGNCVQVTGL